MTNQPTLMLFTLSNNGNAQNYALDADILIAELTATLTQADTITDLFWNTPDNLLQVMREDTNHSQKRYRGTLLQNRTTLLNQLYTKTLRKRGSWTPTQHYPSGLIINIQELCHCPEPTQEVIAKLNWVKTIAQQLTATYQLPTTAWDDIAHVADALPKATIKSIYQEMSERQAKTQSTDIVGFWTGVADYITTTTPNQRRDGILADTKNTLQQVFQTAGQPQSHNANYYYQTLHNSILRNTLNLLGSTNTDLDAAALQLLQRALKTSLAHKPTTEYLNEPYLRKLDALRPDIVDYIAQSLGITINPTRADGTRADTDYIQL